MISKNKSLYDILRNKNKVCRQTGEACSSWSRMRSRTWVCFLLLILHLDVWHSSSYSHNGCCASSHYTHAVSRANRKATDLFLRLCLYIQKWTPSPRVPSRLSTNLSPSLLCEGCSSPERIQEQFTGNASWQRKQSLSNVPKPVT